jgi:hypothetical protein
MEIEARNFRAGVMFKHSFFVAGTGILVMFHHKDYSDNVCIVSTVLSVRKSIAFCCYVSTIEHGELYCKLEDKFEML